MTSQGRRYGLGAARVDLGHRAALVTGIDRTRAAEVMGHLRPAGTVLF